MSRFDLQDDIRKVRVTEKEHKIMIGCLYDDIQTLKCDQRYAETPEEEDYYRTEELMSMVLLRKILPEGSGGSMNRAKRIIGRREYEGPESGTFRGTFNDLEDDPINDAIRKDAPDLPTDKEMQEALERETSSRMGQAGCRGGDCD